MLRRNLLGIACQACMAAARHGFEKPSENVLRLSTQEGAPLESEEVNAWANVTVMWGNLLYEASQMRAAVGHAWRGALDEAVAKFRAAGCPEADIRQALANHTQAAHIELPPLVGPVAPIP